MDGDASKGGFQGGKTRQGKKRHEIVKQPMGNWQRSSFLPASRLVDNCLLASPPVILPLSQLLPPIPNFPYIETKTLQICCANPFAAFFFHPKKSIHQTTLKTMVVGAVSLIIG